MGDGTLSFVSAIGWTAIENAIAAWCLAGSGLASGQVIWSYQEGPRPTPPYLALSLTNVRQAGQDWRDRKDAPSPSPGAEVLVKHRGPRQATLDLQLFAAGAIGETGAVARMHDTLAAIDVNVDALNAAGIGIGEVGAVQLVAGRVNTLLEPRAVTSVELHLFSELESYATYIEHVQLLIKAPPSAPAIELLV